LFSKIQIGFTFLVPTHPGSKYYKQSFVVAVCFYLCVFSFSASTLLVGYFFTDIFKKLKMDVFLGGGHKVFFTSQQQKIVDITSSNIQA